MVLYEPGAVQRALRCPWHGSVHRFQGHARPNPHRGPWRCPDNRQLYPLSLRPMNWLTNVFDFIKLILITYMDPPHQPQTPPSSPQTAPPAPQPAPAPAPVDI